ncbi:MAG: DUF5329 domain-containing protein [Limnobacter sp.]|nr:DUF5329 domain-containing protein [Limnobacter sp.]
MSYKNCIQQAALALCMVQPYAISAPGPSATKEISHLLGFIQESPCAFTRNGKAHSGQDAKKHIQDKRDYFVDDIQSAEDFVRLSATQSELSRKAYTVRCPGQAEEPSKDWLLRELKRYRSNLAKPTP